MLPKEGKLVCTGCGEEKAPGKGKEEYKVVKKDKKKDTMLILDNPDEVQTLPVTKAECAKCGHNKAEWWLFQTRKADEAETRFFRCKKCGFTWREYD